MSGDGPYDYARERAEAENEDRHAYVRINGTWHDASDVPSLADLEEAASAEDTRRRN
jgi:hypothetical protein